MTENIPAMQDLLENVYDPADTTECGADSCEPWEQFLRLGPGYVSGWTSRHRLRVHYSMYSTEFTSWIAFDPNATGSSRVEVKTLAGDIREHPSRATAFEHWPPRRHNVAFERTKHPFRDERVSAVRTMLLAPSPERLNSPPEDMPDEHRQHIPDWDFGVCFGDEGSFRSVSGADALSEHRDWETADHDAGDRLRLRYRINGTPVEAEEIVHNGSYRYPRTTARIDVGWMEPEGDATLWEHNQNAFRAQRQFPVTQLLEVHDAEIVYRNDGGYEEVASNIFFEDVDQSAQIADALLDN